MSRVVIVARTRMHHDHVCIGAHDLDFGFRSLRLLNRFGDHWKSDSPFAVGEIWEMRYRKDSYPRPPHVEDVKVREHRLVGREEDLKGLVLRYRRPWQGPPEAVFEGTLRATRSGTGYVPKEGPLPPCSTGYWLPDADLVRHAFENRVRFQFTGKGDIRGFTWVGTQEPPQRIEAGTLMRVSLTRLFDPENTPAGYYLQISGVL